MCQGDMAVSLGPSCPQPGGTGGSHGGGHGTAKSTRRVGTHSGHLLARPALSTVTVLTVPQLPWVLSEWPPGSGPGAEQGDMGTEESEVRPVFPKLLLAPVSILQVSHTLTAGAPYALAGVGFCG